MSDAMMPGALMRERQRKHDDAHRPIKVRRKITTSPAASLVPASWYCDQCHVAVYQVRCVHCGKSENEKS